MASNNVNQHPQETTPLLPDNARQNGAINVNTPGADISSDEDYPTSPTSGWTSKIRVEKIPVMFRVAPPVFLSALADNMTYLTIVNIMKQFLCAAWYTRNRPDKLPEEGPVSIEKCQIPGPIAWFSAFMVTQNIMVAICAFLVASLVSQYGAMIGRKPILILILFGYSVSIISFTSILFISNDILGFTLLGAWLIVSSLCGPSATILLANLITVDSATPETRTTSLSIVFGAASAGSIPAFLFGGVIEKHAGARNLCLIAIGVSLLALLYASTPLLPETFGKDMREAARLERRERHRQARERSLERWNAETEEMAESNGDIGRGRTLGRNAVRHARRATRKTAEGVLTVFDPILRLKPTKKENGRMNARLIVLASSYFFYRLGDGYLGPAVVSYLTVVMLADPEQSGLVLTSYMVFQLIGYTIVFPAFVKYGRILYAKLHGRIQAKHKTSRQEEQRPLLSEHHNAEQGNRSVAEVAPELHNIEDTPDIGSISSPDPLDNPRSEFTSTHFDVYLLRWCFAVGTVFFCSLGLARNRFELILVSAIMMFVTGIHPTVQSIGAASVEPIITGEIIAGLEMIGSTGRTISPLIIGYVQSKTILTMPSIGFLSMSACVFLGFVLSFFIRDEDRYISSLQQPGSPLSHISSSTRSPPRSSPHPARSSQAQRPTHLSPVSDVDNQNNEH